MSDPTRSRILEVMAEAVRVSRINDVYDADEIASDILAHLSVEGMAVVPVEEVTRMREALEVARRYLSAQGCRDVDAMLAAAKPQEESK